MSLINLSASSCKNCYKCVRVCPVKAIKFSNDHANIEEDRCIACGHCFVICPQNARSIKSDLKILENALDIKKEIVACIAPSFAGFFKEPEKFIAGLKMLGFTSIQEVSVGAEKVTKEYDKYIREKNPKYAISSCCTTVNLMVKKYYTNLSQYLLPIITPMTALAKAVKKEIPSCFNVFIGPCISKKYEATSAEYKGLVDAVVTYEEIMALFNKFNIDIDSLEPQFPDRTGEEIGRKYPISGGIGRGLLQVINEYGYDIIHVEGMDHCKAIFENIQFGNLEKSYIEISACVESCINGPCISEHAPELYTRKQQVKKFVKHGLKQNSIPIDWSGINLESINMTQPITLTQASEKEIISILKKMGKENKEDELDCGACGYDSCRKKAQAVFEGMSEIDMCMPHMRVKAETMNDIIFFNSPDSIFILEDNLTITHMNPSAEKIFQAKIQNIKGKPITILMEDDEFSEVIATRKNIFNKKISYPKYAYIAIQSIIYLDKSNQLLVTMSNITNEEKKKIELEKLKGNTVEVAQKVIEKQMRVAQEIASLLGETTAETKVALNKLKHIMLEEGE